MDVENYKKFTQNNLYCLWSIEKNSNSKTNLIITFTSNLIASFSTL
jgi:hypothetical protein